MLLLLEGVIKMSVGRSLHGMPTTRLHQHRSNNNNTSRILRGTLSQLCHYGTSSSRSKSKRPHFNHQYNSSHNSGTSLPDEKTALATTILLSSRDLHCQHSFLKPQLSPLILPLRISLYQHHHNKRSSSTSFERNFCSYTNIPNNNSIIYCFYDKHKRIHPTSWSRHFSFYSNNSSDSIMSLVHLKTGSTCPSVQDGIVRLYNMKFCPFAQRALLAAEAKGIPYDVVNCNLKDKPEWLFEKNPEGKVPVLETSDGKVLYESLIVADYLDEVYSSQRPLHPNDAYKRAKDRILIDKFGSVITLFYKLIFSIRDDEPDSVKKEKIENFVQGLKPFEDELAKRGSLFFGGDQPGMLDYMIWPWFERVPSVKQKIPDLFDYDAAKTGNPNLEKWRQAMKKDPAVAKFLITPELHLQFMDTFLAGAPNYDL